MQKAPHRLQTMQLIIPPMTSSVGMMEMGVQVVFTAYLYVSVSDKMISSEELSAQHARRSHAKARLVASLSERFQRHPPYIFDIT